LITMRTAYRMVQDNESHFKEPVKYYTGFEMTLSLLKPKKNPRVY